MKFMCLACDRPMELQRVDDEAAGSMAVVYRCPGCDGGMAMVTNPGETQLVHSLGVEIGHEALPSEPLPSTRGALDGGRALEPSTPVRWSADAERRLAAAPGFVQGMVRRLYEDWARQHGVEEITPATMNEAREALGLTGM